MDEARYQDFRVRIATPSDAAIIADMDGECRRRSACEMDYAKALGKKGFTALIAENYVSPVGFVTAVLSKASASKNRPVSSVQVVSFGVIPEERRKYAASQLFANLRTLMREFAYGQIEAEVPERALASQLFLKSQNFKCVGTLNPRKTETWLKFVYRPTPTNRIRDYLAQTPNSVH